MSAPVLTKEQRERLGRWPQDNPSLCQDIVAALAHIDALKAELEAVSERCAMTVKDRDRWNEMYNAEARKHVNAVTALRAERDALAADLKHLRAVLEVERLSSDDRAKADAAKVVVLAEALGDAKHALYRVGMGGDPMDAMTACKAAASVLAAHDASGALNG